MLAHLKLVTALETELGDMSVDRLTPLQTMQSAVSLSGDWVTCLLTGWHLYRPCRVPCLCLVTGWHVCWQVDTSTDHAECRPSVWWLGDMSVDRLTPLHTMQSAVSLSGDWLTCLLTGWHLHTTQSAVSLSGDWVTCLLTGWHLYRPCRVLSLLLYLLLVTKNSMTCLTSVRYVLTKQNIMLVPLFVSVFVWSWRYSAGFTFCSLIVENLEV